MIRAIIQAVVAFIITLGTTLTTLFTQEGVNKFTDLSEVQYATALIGAIMALANTYKARVAPSPSVDQYGFRQKGFSDIGQLFILVVFSLAILLLSTGCSVIKEKPWTPVADCMDVREPNNQTLAACYTTIKILATNADIAADAALISSEQERNFLEELERAVMLLELSRALISNNPQNASDQLILAQEVLLALSKAIPQPE